jgi:hypothetical protein
MLNFKFYIVNEIGAMRATTEHCDVRKRHLLRRYAGVGAMRATTEHCDVARLGDWPRTDTCRSHACYDRALRRSCFYLWRLPVRVGAMRATTEHCDFHPRNDL